MYSTPTVSLTVVDDNFALSDIRPRTMKPGKHTRRLLLVLISLRHFAHANN